MFILEYKYCDKRENAKKVQKLESSIYERGGQPHLGRYE